MRTAVLYDHFTPYVLIQLEELGFCARGEARGFIADGAIEVGGRLPLNTHGGQLGEAYIHGMNGIAEAVRQVRGTSVNQVPGDGPVLVTAGTGVPTSGLILSLPLRALLRRGGHAAVPHDEPAELGDRGDISHTRDRLGGQVQRFRRQGERGDEDGDRQGGDDAGKYLPNWKASGTF